MADLGTAVDRTGVLAPDSSSVLSLVDASAIGFEAVFWSVIDCSFFTSDGNADSTIIQLSLMIIEIEELTVHICISKSLDVYAWGSKETQFQT